MAYNKYQSGKIYEMLGGRLRYVGSTIQNLKERFIQHKTDYKNWKEGKKNYISSFDLFELGDVEIRLLEEYPCEDKQSLHARERYWIEQEVCVNKFVPGRSKEEWIETNREALAQYSKEYREVNREVISQQKKAYCEANRESESKRAKAYRDKNREAVNQKQNLRREKNREEINRKQNLRYESKKVVSGLLQNIISSVVYGATTNQLLGTY
jgi:hypothetical protein